MIVQAGRKKISDNENTIGRLCFRFISVILVYHTQIFCLFVHLVSVKKTPETETKKKIALFASGRENIS